MPLLLEDTGTDVLADILESLRLKGRLFCRCELSAPWSIEFAPGEFSHFHIIQRGMCSFQLHGDRNAIALEEGDMLLVKQGHRYQLSDEPTTPTHSTRTGRRRFHLGFARGAPSRGRRPREALDCVCVKCGGWPVSLAIRGKVHGAGGSASDDVLEALAASIGGDPAASTGGGAFKYCGTGGI